MSAISNYANATGTNHYDKKTVNRKEKTSEVETEQNEQTDKTGKVSGKTVGQPQLSEKAAKYYEQLKKKYSNMDFILVSKDQKENAKMQAANYANASKMVVLIDEDKIERMAEDEDYRKQYEGMIANASGGLSQLKSAIDSSGASVKGYGMQVNDGGTASFFAVLKKSSEAQKARIEKKREEAKAEKKAEEKKAEKKEQEKKADDTVVITASTADELLQKIQDYKQNEKMDYVRSDAEKTLGQHIDFKG